MDAPRAAETVEYTIEVEIKTLANAAKYLCFLRMIILNEFVMLVSFAGDIRIYSIYGSAKAQQGLPHG